MDFGPWHWVVYLDGLDATREAFNFPDEGYPPASAREEALRRVRAYVDALPPGDLRLLGLRQR